MHTRPTQPLSADADSGAWGGLSPGDVIGPYTLVAPLGEGGFGAIFLADQATPVRRRVAMKFVKAGLDSRGVLARFEAERQALAIMDHPHIAKVFDAGATPAGRPYVVMEYVPGLPITEYCDRERLSIRDRLVLFLDVCDAVAHAHAKGVIHRDLKPANILVSGLESGERVVKVIDFGIAKAVQRGMGEPMMTEAGALIGTPEYMSPEQADASHDIDTRTDVYALGVVLYELLTGVLPFDPRELRAAGDAEIRRIIREVDPPRPSTRLTQASPAAASAAQARGLRPEDLSRALRAELEWIPLRAMRKARRERYRSPSDLADDIRNYLAGRPLLAGPESVTYRLTKFARRHRAGVAAACVVAVALVAGLGVAFSASIETARARRESEAVTAFLSDMLSAATPEARGRDVPMRDVLDQASGTIDQRLAGLPRAEATLRRTIGQAYQSLGEFDKAATHLERSYDLRRTEFGPHAPETVRALGDIGGLRVQQGRYDDAVDLCTRALDDWRGEPDAFVPAGIKNNLAAAYSRLGRTVEAIELQRDAVRGLARALGPTHEHTLGSTMNLASMLADRGDPLEAERLLTDVVKGWRENHPDTHPGSTLARTELAGIYMLLQRYPQAEALYREVAAIQARSLGEQHPAAARTRANLATVLSRQGNVAEAIDITERAWADMFDALGPGHVDTLSVAVSLLGMYEAGEWPQSIRERVGPVIATLRAVAQEATAPPTSLNDAAWFLLTVEPASLRDPALALRASTIGCERARALRDPFLWSYLDTLAKAQAMNGQRDRAAETQREAIALLPATQERYRAEMEQRLREYTGTP
jgi:serine/threonine protein kinase